MAKYVILSWNIEHCRAEKIERDPKTRKLFLELISQAHVAFLYEAKLTNNPLELAQEIAKALKNEHNLDYGHLVKKVGTNECVIALYDKLGGVHSCAVSESVMDLYRDATTKFLNNSYNEKVMTMRTEEKEDVRIPMVVKAQWARFGKPTLVFSIGAWHAAGPGQSYSDLLWDNVLAGVPGVELCIGDFNFTPKSKPSVEKHISKFCRYAHKLVPTGQSTTVNSSGVLTNRTEGPDLCYCSCQLEDKVSVEVADPNKEAGIELSDYKTNLSNHLPLFAYIDVGD